MSTITDLRAERERYWSQSRIGLYLLCSLKYAFAYVYKAAAEFTPSALPLGSATHRCMEMLALNRKEGRPMSCKDCQDLFAEVWRRQLLEDQNVRYPEGENADTCLAQGISVVGVFSEAWDESEEVLRVSEALATPLVDRYGNVLPDPLIGELDLLIRDRNGRKIIVDWKTSSARWPVGKNGGQGKADAEVQPTALLYAYKQTYGELPVFRYSIAVKTKAPSLQTIETSRTTENFERMIEVVKAITVATQADTFVPQPNFMCSSCAYQGACSRWHQEHARVTFKMAA
jgi:putative RecB family exonuclease